MEVRSPIIAKAASKSPRKPVVPGWSRLPTALRYLILLVVFVGIWQAYVSLSDVPPSLVASPLDVWNALITDVLNLTIPNAALTTLENLLIGLALGIVLGMLLATLAAVSTIGRDLLTLLVSIFNPLPSIAILPLAMIWFGLTPLSIIFVVTHATMWPVAINADTGFRTISPTLQMVARNLGLKGVRMVSDILLPASLPYILTGVKAAWAFGWRTVVAAELVFGVAGEAGGLGWYINNSRYFLNTPNVFAGLLVISLLGIAVEMLFSLIEKKTIVKWGMKKNA
ncbi:MAG TPA: ABC transporter permease [Chloroflexia bacterium]|nr:ABC transporter permease [Chloroflexia bacterium]